jgi:predicted DsbA family dithiol-disulfide isomerase
MTPMVIDLWSDIVCPYCYLGSCQLAAALADFEHRENVVVVPHAFELDPRAPAAAGVSLDELVAAKYAMPLERARELHRRLEAQAASLGLTWSLAAARPGNTFDAHRIIALASDQGLAQPMSQRLYRAYFSEGVPISDRGRLDELGAEVGVDGASALWSSDAYAEVVRADESWAEDLGITGVPAFLVDGKFMILGAQGAETITDVLRRAWARRAQVATAP